MTGSGRVARARADVARYGRRLAAEGLTTGTGGNLSVRVDDRLVVSPSGVPYDEVTPEDVPVVGIDDGEARADGRAPSSETPLHRECYRRRDVGGVVHTHSPYATTFAVLREPLPPAHYLTAYAGGEVPVAPYARYGTDELAENVAAALTERDACLLANHGVVAVGDSLARAFDVAVAVEFAARVTYQALAVGHPVALTDAELGEAADALADYGRRD